MFYSPFINLQYYTSEMSLKFYNKFLNSSLVILPLYSLVNRKGRNTIAQNIKPNTKYFDVITVS